jgi:acetoin utilization protein AcuB
VLVGIISDRDIRQHTGFLDNTKVNSVMTENPITVTPGITLEDATQLMLRYKFGGLPVVDRGEVVGMITTSDILKAFLDVMGTSQERTARIDVLLEGGRSDVGDAFKLIEANGGAVLAVGTYGEEWGQRRVFYLRVRTSDPVAVADALKGGGYKVLGVHE